MELRRPKPSDFPAGRRPTLKDVAKRAGGVHPSTVSLALRNHPGISDELKKRIRAAAEALGYRPDPLLDAFNTHRVDAQPRRNVNTIAWVVEGADRRTVLADPLQEALWTGAREAAEHFHSQLEFFLVGPGQLSPQRLNTVLKARGITGVVLAGIQPSTPAIPLDWPEFCAVRLESLHLPEPHYAVSFDHRQAFRLAWRRLQDQGCYRIGLALAPSTSPAAAEQYLIGHRFEQHRIRPVDRLDAFRAPSLETEPLAKWVRAQNLDGLIATHPQWVTAAQRSSSSPLQGVCLAGQLAPAGMPATVPDGAAAGGQALEQVVMLLRNHQRGHPTSPTETLLPFLWRAGDSVPAPATRSR